MRYFLDTEYNGWGGALLSLALVPDSGEELYLTLDWDGKLEEWVERNVLPYLDSVPSGLISPRMSRADAARMLVHYLAGDRDPLIVADGFTLESAGKGSSTSMRTKQGGGAAAIPWQNTMGWQSCDPMLNRLW